MVPTLSAVIGGFYTAEDPTPRQAWVARVVMDIPRRFHDLGGVVAVGNDFNDRATKERLPLLEMEMLLAAGLSPMDVIVAATKNSATVCGQGEALGTLEAGKLADLLVLAGDPLTDLVEAVQRVAVVVRGGVVTRPGG
jgi:imidazolonepropionase-like amidohydrolase